MMQDFSDNDSVSMDQDMLSSPPPQEQLQANGQPIKVRKKPGRKPNPASPALRKAQNRAAQRAFRERKERHMRELEIAIKQIREQRDKLHVENEQLKADQEIMRSENWYLKGIVLTLQLVCFQHNLVIPQHGPYINEQALSVLAQSIPESISTYISVNASNKLPIPSKLFGYKHTMKQRDRYLSSGSIVITKEGIHSVPDRSPPQAPQIPMLSKSVPSLGRESSATPDHLYDSASTTTATPTVEDLVHPLEQQQQGQDDEQESSASSTMPPLSPGSVDSESELLQSIRSPPPSSLSLNNPNQLHSEGPRPVMLTEEPLMSNLAAIQTLRLRLRLQSACVRMDSVPFAIQPTILQLTIPHDPRIDLIPTPHMRDRMILFRDQFDLDDCFRCLLGHSVFHGGDPAIAANWQLPPEFFEKYWFLTIDYDLRRTTNRWRRLQGLSELDFKQQKEQQQAELKRSEDAETHRQPLLEQQSHHQNLNYTDLSALLGIDFWKIAQKHDNANTNGSLDPNNNTNQQGGSYPSSLSSDCSYNTTSSPLQQPTSPTTVVVEEQDPVSSFEPVRLTNGYSFSYSKPQQQQPIRKTSHTGNNLKSISRHHPYQKPSSNTTNMAAQTIKLTPPIATPAAPAPPSETTTENDTTATTCHPWDTLLGDASATSDNQDYDLIMDNLIDSEQTC